MYKGMSGNNSALPIVNDYFQRKMLAKLGFSFDSENLTTFEVQCFTIIDNEYNKLKAADLKPKKGTRKGKR